MRDGLLKFWVADGPVLELCILMQGVTMFSKLLCLILFISAPASFAKSSSKKADVRLTQAKELLGSSFKKKVVRVHDTKESKVEINEFVLETVKRFLPKSQKSKAEETGYAILNAAEEFRLDPVFLMAVIQNESSFDPRKRGSVGEIGLMQILPKTAAWIAEQYALEYDGDKSLELPSINIWIGAALLSHLRQQFDSKGSLYLSAYNVGPGKLRKLIAQNTPPKIYVNAVLKRYVAIYEGYKSKGDLKVASKVAVNKVMSLTN
jgi:hypothetical protein